MKILWNVFGPKNESSLTADRVEIFTPGGGITVFDCTLRADGDLLHILGTAVKPRVSYTVHVGNVLIDWGQADDSTK